MSAWRGDPLLGSTALVVAGAVLLAGAVMAQLRGLAAARGSGSGDAAPWWEGYARDGVNLGAAVLALAGLLAAGWGGPAGVLGAPCIALVVFGGDAAFRRPGPRRAVALLLALGAASLAPARPLLVGPIERLFGRVAPAQRGSAAQKSSTLPASIEVCLTDERGSLA